MNPELLVTLVVAGAAAGLLAGLLGVGGGIVFVPALLAAFHARGVPDELSMHLAVGTSLAAIVLTSSSSIRAHARHHSIDWPALKRLLPGLLVGGALGALLAAAIDGEALRRVFSVFLLLVALQLAIDARPAPHRDLPGPLGGGLAGAVIGTLAALLGIGGGTLTAPYLAWCNRPMLRAVGTAAAAGFPLAAAGTLAFALTGSGNSELPALTTGYVAWPYAIGLGLLAMLTAPLGARLARRAPARLLKRVFALALAVVATRLWLG